MYGVELYAAVRLAVVEEGLSHREAGRRFGIDRRTVKKMLRYSAPPGYRRSKPVRRPKLEGFTGLIEAILEADADTEVPRKQTGWLWALARDDRAWGGPDPPGVVYFYAPGRGGFYAPGRGGEYAERFLNGFDGILQVDGYAGYNRLTGPGCKGGAPIRLAYCWAHCRRRLREIYDSSGSEIAAEGLRRIAELYAVEAEIRASTPERRLAERQARSAPLVQAFGDWLRQQRARVSPKSRLGEKLAYIARHWDGLRLFLANGRVEMDSNAVENLVRPIALTRKNALFAGHDEGAVAWGRIASLTQTARLNGVEPYAWLKATLEAIATGHPNSRVDELLPWNFRPPSS